MAITVGQGAEEGEQEVMAAINTTPLVDVMLVLLIIFLITIPVVTQSIPVQLPKEENVARQTRRDRRIRNGRSGHHECELPVAASARRSS